MSDKKVRGIHSVECGSSLCHGGGEDNKKRGLYSSQNIPNYTGLLHIGHGVFCYMIRPFVT